MIHLGDCVDVMAGMEPDSIDAIVTDPPYGLEFMGKEWDRMGDARAPASQRLSPAQIAATSPAFKMRGKSIGNVASSQAFHSQWATAALRVAKPGAYLLAFGGTRTSHRLACAIEDAGWIIRDTCCWVYASGFPKSKASLKPAWEPILLARKPGPLRDLDIEGCRIAAPENVGVVWTRGGNQKGASLTTNTTGEHEYIKANPAGRWPANVILTDPIFDGGWEGVVGGGEAPSAGLYREPDQPKDRGQRGGTYDERMPFAALADDRRDNRYAGDTGTYSRFFLIPKASRSDREPLLPGTLPNAPSTALVPNSGNVLRRCQDCGRTHPNGSEGPCVRCGSADVVTAPAAMNGTGRDRHPTRENTHPTVKPLELMRHLVRLVTPQGGTVLDPFLGSGTTALAAEQEGFAWIGIERESEYVAIAEARLALVQRGLGLAV